MSVPRGPGQRAGLDHRAVLDAAMDLLRDGGSEAVSMRALARTLGVAPNALYSHVASRTALLDELLDDALAAVATPEPDLGDPLAGLHLVMAATYDVLTATADLVPLYLARQGARGPHAIALGRITDALLASLGVGAQAIPTARRVLIVHTIGSAAFDTGPPAPGGDSPSNPSSLIGAAASRRRFHTSLDWLLAGIAHDGRQGSRP